MKNDRIIIGLLGLIFCIFIIIRADFSHINPDQPFIIERGRVSAVHSDHLMSDAYIPTLSVGSQVVDIEVLSGRFSGQVIQIEHLLTRFHNLYLREGDNILVSILPDVVALSPYEVTVYGPSREPVLFVAIGLLAVGMLVVGRSKGLYAMVSLGFTFVTIIFLLIYGIVSGGNPIFLSLLTSLLIICFTTGMISGATKETFAAIFGAIVGLLSAGVASLLLGQSTHISGIHLEGIRHVLYHTPPDTFIRIQDLFFAVVIIATTGAIIDSTVSLSATSFELKRQSPKLTWLPLYKSSMQVGRSVLGANVNTLILSFAGTSLVALLLIVLFGFSPLRIINLDLLAVEIILGVSATVGILVAIPATAFFATYLATTDTKKKKKS